MALRATAPVFVPSSFEINAHINHEEQERPKSPQRTRRNQRRRRPRNRKNSTNDDDVAVSNISKRTDVHHKNNKQTPRRKRKNRKKKNNPVKDDDEANFPPIVVSEGVAQKSNPITASNEWLTVAERAHELERQEEERQEAIRLVESKETVKLTPLVRSASSVTTQLETIPQTTAADSNSDDNHDEVDIIEEPHKPQHYVNTNMEKLRNRWWNLIREKSARDLERQRQQAMMLEQESMSSSSESEEETIVETIAPPEIQETIAPPEIQEPICEVVEDHNELQACLESSYPLHRAVIDNDVEKIRLLQKHEVYEAWGNSFVELNQLGISNASNTSSFTEFSPYLLAVYLDRLHLCEVLAWHPSKWLHYEIAFCDSNGRNALMLAIELGMEDSILAQLARGAPIHNKDNIGNTAAHYACRVGVASSVVKAMLAGDNNMKHNLLKILSCQNDRGQTPLHVACEHAWVHIVEVILSECNSVVLSKLLQICDDDNQTPLLAAVRAESADIVMSLLMWRSNDQGGRQVTSVDLLDGDNCPLSCAASRGSTEMVMLLLEFMDPSAPETGPSLDLALQAAVRSDVQNRLDCMRALVEAGANPCAVLSRSELGFRNTSLSMCCSEGDVRGLTVILDAWERHVTRKQLARRQDPKLRRQPESYFAAIEAKENVEVKEAMTGALLLSSLVRNSGDDDTSHQLDTALTLFHRGAQFGSADFALLKASINSDHLLSASDATVSKACSTNTFVASYRHPFDPYVASISLSSGYDRSPLGYWSHRLRSLPWMQSCCDATCAWMLVQQGSSAGSKKNEPQQEEIESEQVVLVSDAKEFLVDATLVSQKSAKLAAAIRFVTMESTSDSSETLRIQLEIPARYCQWLLEHIYHGSIVSGLGGSDGNTDFALDLMELAFVAEEFLCPSLLQECEMRLLASDPFQCFCWSCCTSVRAATDDASCGECLYRVQGPSRLLNAECVLSALAISDEMSNLDAATTGDTCIKSVPDKTSKSLANLYYDEKRHAVPPFSHVKEAAIKACLSNFVQVTESESFQAQVDSLALDIDNESLDNGTKEVLSRQAELVLLQTCLNDLSSLPGADRRERSSGRAEAHSSDPQVDTGNAK